MLTNSKHLSERLAVLEASSGRKHVPRSKRERDALVAAAIALGNMSVPIDADMHQRAAIEAARRADS